MVLLLFFDEVCPSFSSLGAGVTAVNRKTQVSIFPLAKGCCGVETVARRIGDEK